MIPLLRAGALAVNLAFVGGVPLLLGVPLPAAAGFAAALGALSWWACARAPAGEPAPASLVDEADRLAARLGAPKARFVRMQPGWMAAAVRSGGGYGLLVGAAVRENERRAVLAHEIAHAAAGDLRWEPVTDGPARLLLPAIAALPVLAFPLCPFLLLGVPLARATELRADRLASGIVEGYAAILGQIAAHHPRGPSALYPTFAARIRASARDS